VLFVATIFNAVAGLLFMLGVIRWAVAPYLVLIAKR